MSKIVLTNIYLVNWYGFINTKIPVGKDLTLITGENECGKSTILDAVKYAFSGDAEFNKSSSTHNIGGSRRTLASYTRCLIDASAGTYARPPEKMPNVYSHISLEYYDEVNDNYFILGVILETNASNEVSHYWYAFDHTNMEQVQYTYLENGVLKPYNYQKFQKKYGVQIMTKKDAMIKFMQMTGLKFAYTEISKFQRKLRSIMTYNPAAKIQEFIKESVLEAHDVNFDKLKVAKNNIEKINRTLELIKDEVDALDAILGNFAEHEKVSVRLAVDDAKLIYREVKKLREAIQRDKAVIEKNQIELKHLEALVQKMLEQKRKAEDSYMKARSALNALDCSREIQEEKNRLHDLEDAIRVLEKEKRELNLFGEQLSDMLRMLGQFGEQDLKADVIFGIEADEYTATEKENAVNQLKKCVFAQKDILVEKRGEIRRNQNELEEQILHCRNEIEAGKKNQLDYSNMQNQIALRREINREFKKNQIDAEAKFACEYVVELLDEDWREAIEAFLGIHRYSIIVEPKYFEIANRVMDCSDYRYTELVNTQLLAGKKFLCEEDSVLHKLVIKNEIAEKYFAFWLGKIHAVELTEVPKYENAMSKEGKLSRNMAVTFINFKKVHSYCLGQEAVELNRRRAEQHLKQLEEQEKEILKRREQNDSAIRQLERYLSCFKNYNYNANEEYHDNQKKASETREHIEALEKAQKNNTEYQTLSLRVQELDDALTQLNKELDEHRGQITDLNGESKLSQGKVENNTRKLNEQEEKLNDQKLLHTKEVETAIREFEDYISGNTKDGDVMMTSTRERTDRRKRELEGLIIGGQKDYNRRKKAEEQLPEGIEYEGKYLARKNRIWVDDLQEINAKMAEQTRKYENIFKNEFVLSLYQTALSAKEDIAGINKELRALQFATKYQFEVKLLDDKSDYAKILRYAEYLKKTNKVDDGQMVFSSLYGYEDDEVEIRENEIKAIINRIIDKNDNGVIQQYADYRNYMSYEIIINNVDVKDGKLSKQAGYNSGAGTQIPYTLILSAALSMLYNARINSTRLIFIDEPFEKMSDHNIKLMLDFFKNQRFQVIFCAPSNKTDSIGYECNTIIPVIKIRNDNMQIGSVQFYDK